MIKVSMLPRREFHDQPMMGVERVGLELMRRLQGDFEWCDDYIHADIVISHAGSFHGGLKEGQISPIRADQGFIAVVHGLYPTGDYAMGGGDYLANRAIIQDVAIADNVIVPSRWVGLPLERDMFIKPHVIHWGVNWQDWQHHEPNQGYALWNKNRVDQVCDPAAFHAVAALLPQIQFVRTPGELDDKHPLPKSPNLTILPLEAKKHLTMRQLVQQAGVYIATTKETGDIGSREALASGVPVCAFGQGAVLDFVQHGVNGYVVEPGNIEDLAQGIQYCLKHRAILGANARELAKGYSWNKAASQLKAIIKATYEAKQIELGNPLISVVIPCHNYSQYVAKAIDSVVNQECRYSFEVVVVDDASTDTSRAVIEAALADRPCGRLVCNEVNQGVAKTRNRGLAEARGKFALCLDADDQLLPGALQALAPALLKNPHLGIAYGGIEVVNTEGLQMKTNWLTLPFDYERQANGSFNQVPTCCMYRRADALRIGGYRTAMQPAEDADLWTRLTTFTHKTAKRVTPHNVFRYLMHGGSLSNTLRRNPHAERGLPAWAGVNRGIGAPPSKGLLSNPVRAYENPLICVTLVGEGDTQITMDSLHEQTFWQWGVNVPAPYQVEWQRGIAYPPTALQELWAKRELIMTEFCCGSVKPRKGTPMSQADFVQVEWLQNMGGSKIWSFTKKRDINGKPVGYSSDFAAGITKSLVHKDDVQIGVDRGYWKLVPVSTQPAAQVFVPSFPPPPEPPGLIMNEEIPVKKIISEVIEPPIPKKVGRRKALKLED